MNEFIHSLTLQLNARLQEVSKQELGAIQKARVSAKSVSQILIQLRAFILQHSFRDELEEIDFFKTTKPIILSKYIYHSKIYTIESRRPTGDRVTHQGYLRKEIEKIVQFQTTYPEFYQYYRTGETYSDHIYFLRKSELPGIYDDDLSSCMDPLFSTGYDHLVAKMIANEQLSNWLHDRIDALDVPVQPTHPGTFRWTGSKSALVELIYALDAVKVVNNGNCNIRSLVALFEYDFQIELPDVHRSFSDIKNRKTSTKFIDSLKVAMSQKIEDDLL